MTAESTSFDEQVKIFQECQRELAEVAEFARETKNQHLLNLCGEVQRELYEWKAEFVLHHFYHAQGKRADATILMRGYYSLKAREEEAKQ